MSAIGSDITIATSAVVAGSERLPRRYASRATNAPCSAAHSTTHGPKCAILSPVNDATIFDASAPMGIASL